jgi:RNA polymerase sigma factor (TIGR02999 family)
MTWLPRCAAVRDKRCAPHAGQNPRRLQLKPGSWSWPHLPQRSDSQRAFFAYASKVMRSVIIDAVRERQAERRGGDLQRLTLDTQNAGNLPAGEGELLEVNDALEALAQAEPRLAKVVEMRYFAGYTEAEIGLAPDITERTVRRDWDKARLLLGTLLKR